MKTRFQIHTLTPGLLPKRYIKVCRPESDEHTELVWSRPLPVAEWEAGLGFMFNNFLWGQSEWTSAGRTLMLCQRQLRTLRSAGSPCWTRCFFNFSFILLNYCHWIRGEWYQKLKTKTSQLNYYNVEFSTASSFFKICPNYKTCPESLNAQRNSI